MNTIQASTVLPHNNAGKTDDIAPQQARKNEPITSNASSAKPDYYSATAANDSFVARILSSSIGKAFDQAEPSTTVREKSSSLSEKFEAEIASQRTSINIETVTQNVVGFVEAALGKLAGSGVDTSKLEFFRNEAVKGVEVGIDQAKLELIGVSDKSLFATIDATRDKIIDGVNSLSLDPAFYVNSAEELLSDNIQSPSVNILSKAGEAIKLEFEPNGFDAIKNNIQASHYTSSASNISFSVIGDTSLSTREELGGLINKLDGLANTFYRGDVQGAYNKSVEAGYSDSELAGLATYLDKPERFAQVKTYGDIQHLDKHANGTDIEAPKAVAEYINRYFDVIEASKGIVNSQDDFNEVINGLVNQMKDVQVPDLLHAINSFHAFNNKFAAL